MNHNYYNASSSLLVFLPRADETMSARSSFASATEKTPVVARAASAEKTSVNAYDDEKIHKRFESFFVQLTNKKKEKKKEKNAQSLAFWSNTCDIHKQSNLSLSLSFPSAQTAKRRRRENEEEEISRKKRCLDDEEQGLRPVTIGWCEQ